MATHSVPDLWSLWKKGELTSEQANGHILQNLLVVVERLDAVEKRLRQLEQAAPKPPVER